MEIARADDAALVPHGDAAGESLSEITVSVMRRVHESVARAEVDEFGNYAAHGHVELYNLITQAVADWRREHPPPAVRCTCCGDDSEWAAFLPPPPERSPLEEALRPTEPANAFLEHLRLRSAGLLAIYNYIEAHYVTGAHTLDECALEVHRLYNTTIFAHIMRSDPELARDRVVVPLSLEKARRFLRTHYSAPERAAMDEVTLILCVMARLLVDQAIELRQGTATPEFKLPVIRQIRELNASINDTLAKVRSTPVLPDAAVRASKLFCENMLDLLAARALPRHRTQALSAGELMRAAIGE